MSRVRVVTPWGDGALVAARGDGVVVVALPWGVAHVWWASVGRRAPRVATHPQCAVLHCCHSHAAAEPVPPEALAERGIVDAVFGALESGWEARLRVLHTAGSGDCLLNAASLGMWGVQVCVARSHTQVDTFDLLFFNLCRWAPATRVS